MPTADLNSVTTVAEEKSKWLSKSEVRAAMLVSNQSEKLGRGRGVSTCFQSSFVEFLSAVAEEKSKNASTAILDFQSAQKKINLDKGRWNISSCQVLSNSVQRNEQDKSKMYRPFRGKGGNLGIQTGQKKHKLGRGCWVLASSQVLFSIPFSSYRGEVENVSSHSAARAAILVFLMDRKYKLGRGRWYLASCEVSLKYV